MAPFSLWEQTCAGMLIARPERHLQFDARLNRLPTKQEALGQTTRRTGGTGGKGSVETRNA